MPHNPCPLLTTLLLLRIMLCACSCTVRLSELTFLCGECDAAHPFTLVLKCRVCEEELLWDMAAGARTIAPPPSFQTSVRNNAAKQLVTGSEPSGATLLCFLSLQTHNLFDLRGKRGLYGFYADVTFQMVPQASKQEGCSTNQPASQPAIRTEQPRVCTRACVFVFQERKKKRKRKQRNTTMTICMHSIIARVSTVF